MDLHGLSSSSFALAGGIALLTMILLRRSWRYERRRRRRVRTEQRATRSGSTGGEPAASSDPLRDAPAEVLRWHVALHESARHLQAQLDSKIVIVDRLVREARQEAERLEGLLARFPDRTLESVGPAPQRRLERPGGEP